MQDIIKYLVDHEVVFSVAAVALMDFIFAIKPSIESNGIVHWIYLRLKAMAGK